MNYFKILYALQRGDKNEMDVSVDEQKVFLDSLGEASCDIDRSFKQYLCQNYFVPGWKVWIFNISAAVIMPFVVIYYLFKGFFVGKEDIIDAMIQPIGLDEDVPVTIREKFKPVNRYWNEGTSMQFSDISFLFHIVCHAPHHPFFVLKTWMNVVRYSDMIRRHNPNVMIEYGEYSCSSSILTAYCHRFGIKHINIMHGDKTWFIRDSFFHFDECYVWDEHYVKILIELKAEPTQFRIYIPQSLKIDCEKYVNKNSYAEYKYYLQINNEKELRQIISVLKGIETSERSFVLRPHPRYSDMALLHKLLDEQHIENPSDVGIEESISNCKYVIGAFTTVLTQAYFSGKTAVLDDVVYKKQFEKLKDAKFFIAEKGVIRLSNLINTKMN